MHWLNKLKTIASQTVFYSQGWIKHGEQETIAMPFYQGIATRMMRATGLLLLIPCVVLIFYATHFASQQLVQQVSTLQNGQLQALIAHLYHNLTEIKQDALAMAHNPLLTADLTLAHQAQFTALLHHWVSHRDYFHRLQLYDSHGKEWVRIEQQMDQVVAVDALQLQQHFGRNYFNQALKLSKDQFLILPATLRRHNGQIEKPLKPMLRLLLPVYRANDVHAVLSLEINTDVLLQTLRAMLIDQDGYYLSHPEKNKCWGGYHDLNHHYSLIRDYPDDAAQILTQKQGSGQVGQQWLSFQTVKVSDDINWLLLLSHDLPDNPLLNAHNLLLASLLLLALCCMGWWARRFANEILGHMQTIQQTLKMIRNGNRYVQIPLNSRDEWGQLAADFNGVLTQFKQNELKIQQEKNNALHESIKKTRFINQLAQNFRRPLSSIKTLIQTLQAQIHGTLQPCQQKSLASMTKSADYLLNQLQQALNITDFDISKLLLEIQQNSVISVAEASLDFVYQSAQDKNIDLSVSFDPELLQARIEPIRLKQILVNILYYAIQHTPTGGRMGLETYAQPQQGHLILTVWDTAPLLSNAQIHALFDPLQPSEHKNEQPWLLIQSLINNLEGSLQIENQPSNRFSVRLPWQPIVTQHNPSVIAESSNRPWENFDETMQEQWTLLLAEDHEKTRDRLSKYLTGQGYQVKLAYNGNSVVKLAQTYQIQALLINLQITQFNISNVFKRLRKQDAFSHMPIIGFSSLILPDDVEQYRAMGLDFYLPKPIQASELVKILQEWHSKK
jgi:signal transduction histidine kinase/CheY-like chemotaxis protein